MFLPLWVRYFRANATLFGWTSREQMNKGVRSTEVCVQNTSCKMWPDFQNQTLGIEKSVCDTFQCGLRGSDCVWKPYRDYRNSPNSPKMDLNFKEAELCPQHTPSGYVKMSNAWWRNSWFIAGWPKFSHEASQRTFLPCPPCQTHVKSSFAWIHGTLDCVESRTWQAKSI